MRQFVSARIDSPSSTPSDSPSRIFNGALAGVSLALVSLPLYLLVGCGGGNGPASSKLNLAITGETVTKVRTAGKQIVLLEEHLNSIFEDGPNRSLALLQADGHTLTAYEAPSGWAVVDFAVHPSGDISAILTTHTDVRIVRLDSKGSVRSDQTLSDPAATVDPYFNYAGGLKDDNALQPALMHDAARLAPLGEGLAVVLRTGRNAIVAYRLDVDSNGAYTRSWRTLVEPGSSILLEGITSGSFDVFGQLQNHLRIFADADSDTLAVGAVNAPERNFTFRAHSEYFAEPISALQGVLLTRIAIADGRRLGSTAIDTHNLAEMHGMRATPQGFITFGRILTEVRADGSGWDAFTAIVRHDGTPGPYSVIDVDRGDVFFDIAPLSSGQFLALGSTGYTQNPSGASISEAAQPLLALLNADGTLDRNFNYVGGARHNQLTTIAPLGRKWILGGMVNGPGTHSGDADHNLIVADGFVRDGFDLPLQ